MTRWSWHRSASRAVLGLVTVTLSLRATGADSVTITGHVPPQDALPKVTSACPELAEGVVRILDSDVQVIVAGRKDRAGPLIIYWHGTGSSAERELPNALGESAELELRELGGLLIAPENTNRLGNDTTGNSVWHAGDMRVADGSSLVRWPSIGSIQPASIQWE